MRTVVVIFIVLKNVFSYNELLQDNYEAYVSVEEEYPGYAVPIQCDQFCNTRTRKKRQEPPGKSRVIEAMLKAPTLNLNPDEPDILSILRDRYELPEGFKGPLSEYDFIVVGAGSAGSVLASRLSEGKQASVLLLEAGRPESLVTDVPILAPFFQQTDYVWHYLMEPQPNVCMGMEGGRCFWPRGKAVGGSSVINYMIYTRGLPTDWNRIASDGNYGWYVDNLMLTPKDGRYCWDVGEDHETLENWTRKHINKREIALNSNYSFRLSYQEVLPYYIKSERANLKGLQNSPWHGRDGEQAVEYVPFKSKLSKAFLDAGKFLGHRRVDYNSPDYFGFSYIQATMSKGRRWSTAKAFLHSKKKRKNLHILHSTRATKVLIDPATKTAYGVEFQRNGLVYQIKAKKEVILSAGPIESPHLLMLSGIGPKEHLESFGIRVIQDLRVGETLYDHISFPALAFTLNTSRLTVVEKRDATIQNVMQYNHYGEGPMTSLAGVETIGYIKTNVSDEFGDLPDIELLGTCASLASDEGNIVAKGLHLADWLYRDAYKPIENVESFSILFMLLHPKSKGHLKLRSENPFDDPKLYGNYLMHPKDVATTIAAIRYIIKLVDTPPFQKYGAKLHTTKFPNCNQYEFGSDNYWECAVRTVTSTLHHQIATCKMGPAWDPDAIVDPELRVYRVNNLRVVDSSVIPRTIVAHTNAPAIMIGEKAADMIKRSWGMV